jgi:hypothetical protein
MLAFFLQHRNAAALVDGPTAATHPTDVVAQGIELVGIRQGHADGADPLLQPVEFALQSSRGGGGCDDMRCSMSRSCAYQRNTRERTRNSYSGGTMRDSGSMTAMMMPSTSHMRSMRLASQNFRYR